MLTYVIYWFLFIAMHYLYNFTFYHATALVCIVFEGVAPNHAALKLVLGRCMIKCGLICVENNVMVKVG